MIKMIPILQSKRAGGVLLAMCLSIFLAGCASTPRTVPFAVQSDPLGAHVLFKATSKGTEAEKDTGDWIYLGVTPIDLRRELGGTTFKKDDAFTLRVMKDGYLEQRKTWGGDDIKEQMKSIGKVFWNPRLVPAN